MSLEAQGADGCLGLNHETRGLWNAAEQDRFSRQTHSPAQACHARVTVPLVSSLIETLKEDSTG